MFVSHSYSAEAMQYLVILALLLGVASAGLVKRAANGDQNPKVWDALDKLRGKGSLTVEAIQDLYPNVVPGSDFPLLATIPQRNIDCASFKQPGFYADADAGRCQIFDRCDINGNLTSYLCPNMTLFNQITLICDWWYNIDCSQAKSFQDYSNSRLYQVGLLLLDDQAVLSATGAAAPEPVATKSNKKSGGSKKKAAAPVAAGKSDDAAAPAAPAADAAVDAAAAV